ncbi:MAG: GNAT family N-acetyltransferase [Bacillota bacterium]
MDNWTIRDYMPEDEQQWLFPWERVVTTSHAWFYVVQRKPVRREGSVELVVEAEGQIVGFMDIEIEDAPGEFCYRQDQLGGFVWEFGVLKEYRRRGIGTALLRHGAERAAPRGATHLEFWSMDPGAWEFYRQAGMLELERHYAFFVKPSPKCVDVYKKHKIYPVRMLAHCSEEAFSSVRRRDDLILSSPFEPHLCIGFDYALT